MLDNPGADEIVVVDDHEEATAACSQHAFQHAASLVGAEGIVEILHIARFAKLVHVVRRKGDALDIEAFRQVGQIGALIRHDDSAPIVIGLVQDGGDGLHEVRLEKAPIAGIVLMADRDDEGDEGHRISLPQTPVCMPCRIICRLLGRPGGAPRRSRRQATPPCRTGRFRPRTRS
jgi:hypothetical protein